VVSGDRKRALLVCGQWNPDLVLVSRATFGMDLERQSKRLGVRFVPLAFVAVVAVDCGDRGIQHLVVDFFVLAVFVAISLAFICDRARKVGHASRRAIEPTNYGRRSGPDDVATAEVVPEGKRKDEQEESEHYMGIAQSVLLTWEAASRVALTKNHVEEGKGLENAVASVIYLVRIWKGISLFIVLFGNESKLTAFHIVVYNDAVFFRPAYYLGIGNGRVSGDCTKSCRKKEKKDEGHCCHLGKRTSHTKPENGEETNPEEFPSCLGDRA